MINGIDKKLEDYSVVKSVDYGNNACDVFLGDKTVKLIANFRNIERLQVMTGLGELDLMRKLMTLNHSVVDVAKVIYCLIEKGDNRFSSYEEVGDAIVSAKKYSEFTCVAIGALALALNDGEEKDDKKKPVVKRK